MEPPRVGVPRWRAVSHDRVRMRRWDDGLVVYRIDSGDTFRFEPAAGQLLDRLAEGPTDIEALLDGPDITPDEDSLDDLLRRLEQAGLIVRDPDTA